VYRMSAKMMRRALPGLALGSVLLMAGCGAPGHPGSDGGQTQARNPARQACAAIARHSEPLQDQPPKTNTPFPLLGRIQAQAFPNTVIVGQHTTICGTAWLAGNQLARHYPINVVGVHGPSSSQFAITNASGRFAFTATWNHAGTVILNLGDGPIGMTLKVTVSGPKRKN